ncbi:MAG: MMPL family transporter [Actinomycetota bacterium]
MRRALRAIIPAVLILAWLGIGGVGGPYFGKVSEVSSNDQTTYLPASADATKVQKLLADFSDTASLPAVVLFTRTGGITAADRAYVESAISTIAATSGVNSGVSPAIPSKDGEALEVVVPIGTKNAGTTVATVRTELGDGARPGLGHYVTGPAGFTADLVSAFAGIDGILLLAALGAVFLILVIVYRSPLLPILVLGSAVFALCASILTVWWLAKGGIVTLNGQVQGILFILVIGAATDYSLLYVSRYKEALRDHEKRWDATWAALRGSVEPILASGGTVMVGLLCLLFSDLNSNKALGPVGAIGVAFSVLAALTLLPALLLACGRASFWPVRPTFGSPHPRLVGPSAKGLWAGVGRLVSTRSRPVWIIATVVLLAAGGGLLGLRATGVPQSDLILSHSEARDGQAALGKHYPGGSGSPAVIVGPATSLDRLADAVAGVSGVQSVAIVATGSPTGTLPTGSAANAPLYAEATPKVVGGRVMLQATLDHAADSAAAEKTVVALRSATKTVSSSALVGGVTATAIDTNQTSIDDRNKIIPIVLAVILLILMLLLRSILAPVLLIASVIVSFAAALGVSALVFDGIFHFPGADPSVPLYGFVFLVALGIDYNIFLMTRVREESKVYGTRQGIVRGLGLTGGVITSAGIVLAATFSALSVIPVLFLVQIAFIVAFGVLLDTLVVRTLLVPALASDLGKRIWWPSPLSRRADN